MRATVVIGANFGDEGKGLMTDYLCAPHSTRAIVVRFNGGAQAGHTVVTPDGVRHVFHHFGAGTYAGAATYLSRFFIVNPILWAQEREKLPSRPMLVHRDAPLSTPYDMLINRELERHRGGERHGSCGLGINETIERNSRRPYRTTVRDLQRPDLLRVQIDSIRSEYAEERLAELGVSPSDFLMEMLESSALIDHFLIDCNKFRFGTTIGDDSVVKWWDHVVFEGAQGLLLDEDHRFFPHVTRSKTGLTNVLDISKNLGITDIHAVYVTRAYMTRHGCGPFPTEDASLQFTDPTNVSNEFQGALRFGHLDIALLAESIHRDLEVGHVTAASVAVTCLDQVDRPNEIISEIENVVGLPVQYQSHGPTRKTITGHRAHTAGINGVNPLAPAVSLNTPNQEPMNDRS